MQMATRLATQRNFVTITPSTTQTNQPTSPPRVCNQMISSPATSSPSSSPPAGNELFHITSVGGDEETVSVSSPNGTTLNAIPLQQLVHQKKFILNTETGAVSLIDIPSVDHSDSSNETVHTVQVDGSVSSKESSMQELTASGQSNEQNNAQQVTAQVAVVQAQNNDGDNSGPHFTIVSVSQDNGSHGYVQYVDSDLYTTAANSGQGQSQMAYPVYAVGDYSAGNQQYYTTTGTNFSGSPQQSPPAGSSANTYIVPVDEALLANQARESPQNISADVAYIQGANSQQQHPAGSSTPPSCIDGDNSNTALTHATRISPATVCWLMENYETAEGVSLPRSTLYNHYMRHCNEHKLDAVNAASFGKLIRSVFTGLRTRRLGTRGNSKYHYYGIRVKPGSTLVYALDEKPQGGGSHGSGVGGGPSSGGASSAGSAAAQANRKKAGGLKQDSNEACLQFLGDGTNAIPAFPKLVLPMPLPDDITLEDVDTLRAIYREHYEAFLDAILSLEFSTVDSLWHEFWRSNDNNNGDECEEEKYLTKAKLYKLCQCEPVQLFIKHVDFIFYQNMVDVLIPDVLRPIPSSLTQLIRNFAKNLENWLASAMVGCPEKIVQIKMSAVSAFSQTLRRYTSLNHLAQAARAVLQNGSQIAQMLNDLNRVDFHNVQEQASWVCQCDTATVVRLENDFKLALQQQSSLEQWASWLRLVVESALEEYVGKASYARAARQFLLKWSFYSSMVIRDLTLRSAASFGSFHLIRLLYDEYMFFIVEHKVAEATNTSPIAVMSEVDRMQHCASPDTDLEVMFSMPSSDYDNIKIESSPKRMRS